MHDHKKAKKNNPLINDDDPVDGIVRGVASFVGFVSEVSSYRKEKKKLKADTKPSEPKAETSQYAGTPFAELPGTPIAELPATALIAELPASTPVAELSAGTPTAEQMNEAIWQQDEVEQKAQEMEDPRPEESKPDSNPDEPKSDESKAQGAEAFLARHPYQGNWREPVIEHPVVLPQRRPKTRKRGFVRAYSPVLADVGIDQETFLDFIDSLNTALEPNPWLDALDLAELALGAIPEPISALVLGIAAEITVAGVVESNSRLKSASFLDRVNQDFFIPRGMVCFIATWKSKTKSDHRVVKSVDFNGMVAKTPDSPPQPTEMTLVKRLKDIEEKTSSKYWKKVFQERVDKKLVAHRGPFEYAEPAPLIFPSSLETMEVMKTKASGKKKNAFDRGEVFVQDFMDKRAQAKYIRKNPDLAVASSLPRPEFRSRFADPNHPAASGDIVALFTGGTWSTKGKVSKVLAKHAEKESEDSEVEKKRKDGRDQNGEKEDSDSDSSKKSKKKEKKEKHKEPSALSGISSLLQDDVLYLIVLSLPSNVEVPQAPPQAAETVKIDA